MRSRITSRLVKRFVVLLLCCNESIRRRLPGWADEEVDTDTACSAQPSNLPFFHPPNLPPSTLPFLPLQIRVRSFLVNHSAQRRKKSNRIKNGARKHPHPQHPQPDCRWEGYSTKIRLEPLRERKAILR